MSGLEFSDTEVDFLLFVLGLVWFGLVHWVGLDWIGLGGIRERRVETGFYDRNSLLRATV